MMKSGDVVTDQVTLDMCGATFASEALRVARHQVSFQGPNPNSLGVSNEVVSYQPGGAAKALAEVRHAAATCPRGLVQSTVADMPATQQRVKVLTGQPRLLPSSVSLSISATVPSTGERIDEQIVYLVRGSVLAGVYVDGSGAAAQKLAQAMAKVVAAHMLRLVPAA